MSHLKTDVVHHISNANHTLMVVECKINQRYKQQNLTAYIILVRPDVKYLGVPRNPTNKITETH